MGTNLKYIPTFRARQQEILVLQSFNFETEIYPCIEIVKEHDRERRNQKSFNEIYGEIIDNVKAEKVFIDLPLNLKESGSMQDEILEFSRRVISNRQIRTEYILKLDSKKSKIIPVISSYLMKTGESNTITPQVAQLRKIYESLAFRIFVPSFEIDWSELIKCITAKDFLIIDLDIITPYPTSPVLRKIVEEKLKKFIVCPKIVLRSAINTDIQNVTLEHGNVIYEADNSLLEMYKQFSAEAFGDYGGIKKDDLTAGGSISPGFIFYDAVENQYYGFKAEFKNLSEFETTIVPSVLKSESVKRMKEAGDYLVDENWGWSTLQKISRGEESGKSQAKFKRIAMEHYLHCVKVKIKKNAI